MGVRRDVECQGDGACRGTNSRVGFWLYGPVGGRMKISCRKNEYDPFDIGNITKGVVK